jgi:hypothetical protein
MAHNEERERVLDMLYTGKLTGAQADQLLRELGAAPLTTDEKLSTSQLPQAATDSQAGPLSPAATGHREDGGAYTVDELVRMRAQGVDPAYVDAIRNAGFVDLLLDEVIEMHAQEIDPVILARFRRAGLDNLSVHEILQMHAHELDPEYVARLQDAGFAHLPFDQLLELAVHRIDPRYLKLLHEAGLSDLPFDTLLASGMHEVNVADLQTAVQERQHDPAADGQDVG